MRPAHAHTMFMRPTSKYIRPPLAPVPKSHTSFDPMFWRRRLEFRRYVELMQLRLDEPLLAIVDKPKEPTEDEILAVLWAGLLHDHRA